MFKIGEFSKLTQVSIRMLRYYDEAGLLKPAKTDAWTGYRMYSAEQIPTLNKIIYLRDSGFQVSEIAAALAAENEMSLIEHLDKKYQEIQENIKTEQERLQKILLVKKDILHGQNEMPYNVTIKSIPGIQVLSLRRILPDYYGEGLLWKEMSDFAEANRIPISPETFSLYHDQEYKETQVDVEICAPVKKSGKDTGDFIFRFIEPVSVMACTMVYGHFSNIAGAYLSFAEWLQKNERYQMTAPSRQIVHRGPWNEDTPKNFLTEIQIPLLIKKD